MALPGNTYATLDFFSAYRFAKRVATVNVFLTVGSSGAIGKAPGQENTVRGCH